MRPLRIVLALVGGLAIASAQPLTGCAVIDPTAEVSGSEDNAASKIFTFMGLVAAGGTTFGVVFMAANDYLDENRREIRAALSRGAGGFVVDVAAALELSQHEVPRVGRLLWQRRAALDRHFDDPAPFDDQRAAAFADEVREALSADPRLLARLDAFRARLQAMAQG